MAEMKYCPECKRYVNARKRSAGVGKQVVGFLLGGVIGVGIARHCQPYECPICGCEFLFNLEEEHSSWQARNDYRRWEEEQHRRKTGTYG